MNSLDISIKENNYQLYGLVALRVLIGWHFLYEGIAKLINPLLVISCISFRFKMDFFWFSKINSCESYFFNNF